MVLFVQMEGYYDYFKATNITNFFHSYRKINLHMSVKKIFQV